MIPHSSCCYLLMPASITMTNFGYWSITVHKFACSFRTCSVQGQSQCRLSCFPVMNLRQAPQVLGGCCFTSHLTQLISCQMYLYSLKELRHHHLLHFRSPTRLSLHRIASSAVVLIQSLLLSGENHHLARSVEMENPQLLSWLTCSGAAHSMEMSCAFLTGQFLYLSLLVNNLDSSTRFKGLRLRRFFKIWF